MTFTFPKEAATLAATQGTGADVKELVKTLLVGAVKCARPGGLSG